MRRPGGRKISGAEGVLHGFSKTIYGQTLELSRYSLDNRSFLRVRRARAFTALPA